MYLILTYIVIFVYWGFYRYFTNFPSLVDEVIIKPILWIGPVILVSHIKRINLKGLGFKKIAFQFLILSIAFGIGLAALQLVPIYLKNPNLLSFPENPHILALSLMGTAFSEEILFRGFFYKQFQKYYSGLVSNLIASFLFAFIHLPVLIFDQHIVFAALPNALLPLFLSSIGFGFLFSYTKNLWSPIIAHLVMDFLLFFS